MSAAALDPLGALRREIEDVAQREDWTPDMRLASLSGWRRDLTDLLGRIDTYSGSLELVRDARDPNYRVEEMRLREDADLRRMLVERGLASEEEMDALGYLTHGDIDRLDEEALLEAWIEEGLLPSFDPLKHPRSRGGKFTDVLGRIVAPKGRHGRTVPLPKGRHTPAPTGEPHVPAEPHVPDPGQLPAEHEPRVARLAGDLGGAGDRVEPTAEEVASDLEKARDIDGGGWPEKGDAATEILGDSNDTRELHTVVVRGQGGTRVYTPEREKHHDEIIDTLLRRRKIVMNDKGEAEAHPDPSGEPLKAPQGTPVAVFMGGGTAPLALDTPVPTPSGWTTMGAVEAGDFVFAADGTPSRVSETSPVFTNRPCFAVVFDDGSEIVADAAHRWTTSTRNERRKRARGLQETRGTTWHVRAEKWMAQAQVGGHNFYLGLHEHRAQAAAVALAFRREQGAERGFVGVRTTAEIAASLAHGPYANHSIENAEPLALPDALLPLDPYVLGVWLGDGTSSNGSITTADEEIVWHVRAAGFEVRKQKARYRYGVLGLHRPLRQMGLLGSKRVPAEYLRASCAQRRALLAGLLDTDGHASDNGVAEFYSKSKVLAASVFELVVSLGYRPTLRRGRAMLNGRDCGEKWTVAFTADVSPFRLARKRDAHMPQGGRQTRRFIVGVRPVESVPVRCLTVENESHLFLVGRSMIPTHNSGKSTALGLDENADVVPPDAVHIDPDEIKSFLPEYVQMVRAKDRYAAVAAHEESSRIAARLRTEALKRGLNVVIDGTGDSKPGKFAGKMRDMKGAGYEVHAFYVNAPTEVALARAVKRAQKTGRWVPESEVRSQHSNVSARFPEIQGLVEDGTVSRLRMYQTDGPPVLMAEGGGGAFTVHDDGLFQRFLAKSAEGGRPGT